MKKRVVLFAMITVLGCRGFCTEEKDGIYYANLVSGADFYKSKTHTIFLLSELDMYTGIGYGGKYDSAASEVMQYVVFRSAKEWLFESDGSFLYSTLPKTDGKKLWIDRLSVSPQDTQGLLGLLSHTNAVVRFIGLEKCRRLQSFSPELVNAIKRIVQADSFVRYYARSNDNPEDPFKDFHADLRDLAVELLAEKGVAAKVDKESIARKGIDQFLCSAKNGKKQLILQLMEFEMDSRTEGYRIIADYKGNDAVFREIQDAMKAAFLRRGGRNIKRLTSCVTSEKIPSGTNTQNEGLMK